MLNLFPMRGIVLGWKESESAFLKLVTDSCLAAFILLSIVILVIILNVFSELSYYVKSKMHTSVR
jgi:ABC-type lipoprotein release transport system permease subunit